MNCLEVQMWGGIRSNPSEYRMKLTALLPRMHKYEYVLKNTAGYTSACCLGLRFSKACKSFLLKINKSLGLSHSFILNLHVVFDNMIMYLRMYMFL